MGKEDEEENIIPNSPDTNDLQEKQSITILYYLSYMHIIKTKELLSIKS